MTNKSEPIIWRESLKQTFPIAVTAIPFGTVMGTVAANSNLSEVELFSMNTTVFAGASQLVLLDLYNKNSNLFIIILSSLLINARLILYSMSLSFEFKNLSYVKKAILSFFIIDQTYAIYQVKMNKDYTQAQKYQYFIISGLTMFIFWQIGVLFGFLFGSKLPFKEHIDFLVPLAFIGIFGPLLKSKINLASMTVSIIFAVILYRFPYNLGLLISTFIGMGIGYTIVTKKLKL